MDEKLYLANGDDFPTRCGWIKTHLFVITPVLALHSNWSGYRPITFTRTFEPRHNILSNDCTNVRKYSLVKIICNAGQQMRYYLYVIYSHPTVVQLELSTLCGAPLAPSKLYNCFTIAVYCRRKVVTVNFH